jgi:hypothetical protein
MGGGGGPHLLLFQSDYYLPLYLLLSVRGSGEKLSAYMKVCAPPPHPVLDPTRQYSIPLLLMCPAFLIVTIVSAP